MTTLGNKMVKGVMWMMLVRWFSRGIGLASTVILARLLVPADFGLVAMATAMIAVLELFGAFGFDVALIQNQHAERRHYDTVWTFNLLFAAFCALTLVAFAVPTSSFYREPRLEAVMYVLAASYFIGGFGNIGTVNFRKDLDFRSEFILNATRRVATFVATVACAYWMRSYWALVIGMVTGKVVGVVSSYIMHPYRPWFSLEALRELFSFSKWMFVNNIGYFLNQRAADFVVARIAGSHALGIYSLSYEVSNLPTSEISAPINRAVLPGYAKISHDHVQLKKHFLNVLSILGSIAVPAGIGISAIAHLLVPVLLGPKWLDAVPLIQVLGIYGMLQVVHDHCSVVYMATGIPKILGMLSMLNALILLSLVVSLTYMSGIEGTAFAFLISAMIIAPINFGIIKKQLGIRIREFVTILWRPVFGSVAMYGAIYGIDKLEWLSEFNQFAQLSMLVVVGACAYSVILMTLWLAIGRPQGFESLALEHLGKWMASHRGQ